MHLSLDHWCDFAILKIILAYTKEQILFLIAKCEEKQYTGSINLDPTSFFSICFTLENVIIYNGIQSTYTYEKMNNMLNFILVANNTDVLISNINNYKAQLIFSRRPKLNSNVDYQIDSDGNITHKYIEVEEIKYEPSRTINWKTPNIGYVNTITSSGHSSSSLCYSNDYGKYKAFQNCCCVIIKESKIFYSIINELECDKKILLQIINNETCLIEPKLSLIDRNNLNHEIAKKVIDALHKYYEACNALNINTKLALVAKTGGKRDWRTSCFYCLEDENMGETCKCGHHQTIMFEPCAHTICLEPCFTSFVSSLGICKDFGFGPVKMLNNIPCRTVKRTDVKMEFICPCCKSDVIGVFCVEKDVFFNEVDSAIFFDLYDENIQLFDGER
jgi:hypothetical protein